LLLADVLFGNSFSGRAFQLAEHSESSFFLCDGKEYRWGQLFQEENLNLLYCLQDTGWVAINRFERKLNLCPLPSRLNLVYI